MDLSMIRHAFREHIPDMTPSSSKVSDWINDNIFEIAWTGIEDVSRHIGVSTATVVKTVKQCGFEGYSDLQRKIREEIPDGSLVWKAFQEHPQESVLTPIGAVIADEKSNLDQLESAVAPVFKDFVSELLQSPRILVVASLMTAPIAEYLGLHLRLLLGNVDFADAGSSQAWLRLRDMGPADCVIGLSYPRYSQATLDFLTKAALVSSHVMLITDLTGPALPKMKLTINLPSKSHYHYSSNVSLMALVHILARGLTQSAPDRVAKNLEAVDTIWSQLSVLKK